MYHKHSQQNNVLQVTAWETTRKCNMNCKHCRGNATSSDFHDELTTEEAYNVLKNLALLAPKSILILTGGEPMSRTDIFDIASFATSQGLRVVMATCGSMLNLKTVKKLKSSGVKAISLSIDGANCETHDSFRGTSGAFNTTLKALEYAQKGELPFQINTTVSKHNINQLSAIHDLAVESGASVLDFFFLVPTGRGRNLKDLELDRKSYEKTLHWIYDLSKTSALTIKTTCAPHYARVQAQRAGEAYHEIPHRIRARRCMGGKGFIFISHRGIVQPCGFLNLPCGNLRNAEFDLKKIYDNSSILQELRDFKQYKGACAKCESLPICGGCRARAYEASRDYLAEEPNCVYQQT